MERGSDFDFPCSATFRHFDAEEHYGLPRMDYEPRESREKPGIFDYEILDRLDAQEKSINHLYALMAMRQVERREVQLIDRGIE